MAKFFKDDIDNSNKTKGEHGGLIEDLKHLGSNKQNDFLRGFPKTPAELAAEKAEEQAKLEAAARAEAEMERELEEENEKIYRQILSESEQEADGNDSHVSLYAESLTSGQVKSGIERASTHAINTWERLANLFSAAQEGTKEFSAQLGAMGRKLVESFSKELAGSGATAVGYIKRLKALLVGRMNTYYEQNPEKHLKRHRKNRKLMRRFIQAKNNFIAKEKATATKMVGFINSMDDKNEELADKTTVIVKEGNKKFNFAREWAELNKRRLLFHFSILVVIAIGCVAVFNYCTAYEYSYNGRTLGMVKRQEDVLRIVDIVSEQLSKEHNAEIYIDKEEDIAFNRVFAVNKGIDDTEAVLKRLTYMKNMSAKAYAIYINDVRTAIVDNEATAKSILENIKDMYLATSAQVEYENIGFKEDIQVRQIDTKLGRIQNVGDVVQKLMTGAVFMQTHTVAPGDTLSGIAKNYNMTIGELLEANQTINPERLSIGQEIVLTKPAPMVTIQTVEVATYMAPIPHETEYQDSSSLYKGEKNTKVKGMDGERSVTARITRENGVQVASTELASKVVSNPVTEVVIQGTKELPPLQGTGSLRYPVSGYRLTSKFGSRWGRMHYGLDLACPTGTRIGAADGGTVIFSGYSGSYGYVVKINHGGGIVTVYAHCSKLHVKKGDRVYQGQHIANVGNTGRSTGPHCHFEVQVNGVAKNPMNYL